MATYKKPKPKLKPDEYIFRCPHCYAFLVKSIDVYNEENIKAEHDFCPECSGRV